MLVSTLLVSMPHNRLRALEAAARSVVPFFVRRAEHFMEQNARHDLDLDDLAKVAVLRLEPCNWAFVDFKIPRLWLICGPSGWI
jgi:hypothetical protein